MSPDPNFPEKPSGAPTLQETRSKVPYARGLIRVLSRLAILIIIAIAVAYWVSLARGAVRVSNFQ